jgi:tubby and related proteins|tara:strand:+ start:1117 stop:1689 length:573 start_codon:yes stop_codon:yes gene_type:complete
MLTGKKKGMNTTSHYMITIDQQKFQKDANGYLGKVRSNMLGTEFSIYDCKENPKKSGAGKEETRQQLGVVQYETNVLGSKGPRRMKVLLPMVSRDGQELYWPDTEVEKDTIQGKFADNETENIMFYFNKPPKWNEQVQAFVLNFNGRVDKASVKNFQLIDEYDDNKIYMQFGRVGKDAFNMDVAFPFSIF